MSLQEIEKHHITQGSKGLEREIDANSKRLVLDILQNTQYSLPIESSIREIASNAVDAQTEKEIAIKILTGKMKVEEAFVERKGDQYEASKFDSSYYDLDHLDTENNRILIEYKEAEGTGFCDQVSVTDYGVGLGKSRLAGVFQLGYSTKRNTKHALGSFGIGNKSPIATGVPYYTIETAYNGLYASFNCYPYKIEGTVPRFNPETEELNPQVNISSDPDKPYLVYASKTTAKNFTRISWGSKRHNRNKYRDAVRSQLTYFDVVDFDYYYEHNPNSPDRVQFQSKVLYNSPNLIVTDSSRYTRPHILVVKDQESPFGVNYGPVNFQELEINQMFGAVGFKCPIRGVIRDPDTGQETVLQEGVSATPNREAIVWDEHSRSYLLKLVDAAVDEVQNIVSKTLSDEKDFFKWLKAASAVKSGSSYSSDPNMKALHELSRLVGSDRYKINPVFTKGKFKYKYSYFSSHITEGLKVRYVKLANGGDDIDRTDGFYSETDLFSAEFYEMDTDSGKASKIKDKYLLNNELGTSEISSRFYLIEKTDINIKDKKGNPRSRALIEEAEKVRDFVYDQLRKSSRFHSYQDVEVPKDFEKIEEAKEQKKALSAEQLRKMSGKITVTRFYFGHDSKSPGYYASYKFLKESMELSPTDLADTIPKDCTVLYGTQADLKDLETASAIIRATKSYNGQNNTFPAYIEKFNSGHEKGKYFVLRLSKRNIKHVKDLSNFMHVGQFVKFATKADKPGTLETGTLLKPIITSRFLYNYIQQKYPFLNNLGETQLELQKAYKKIKDYVATFDIGGAVESSLYYSEGTAIMDTVKAYYKAIDMQLYLRNETSPDSEKLLEMTRELFQDDTISEPLTKVSVIDENILDLMDELVSFAEPLKVLNKVPFVAESKSPLGDNEQELVDVLIRDKDLLNFSLSKQAHKTIENSINLTNN